MTTSEQMAIAVIREQLEPILIETAATEAKLSELKQSKAKLEAALKVLTGGKSNKSRKSAKPYAKKDVVMKVCLAMVRDNTPIPKSDLELLVKDKLGKDMGYSLSGVQLRLRECLAAKQFVEASDGRISISAEPDMDANTSTITD